MRRNIVLAAAVLVASQAQAQPFGLAERAANTTLLIDEAPAAAPEPHGPVAVFPSIVLPDVHRIFGDPSRDAVILVAPSGVFPVSLSEADPQLGAAWFQLPEGWSILDAALGEEVAVTVCLDSSEATPRMVLARHTPGSGVITELPFSLTPESASAAASLVYTTDGHFVVAFGDLGRPQLAEQAGAYEGGVWELDPTTLVPSRKLARGLRSPRLFVDPLMGTTFIADSAEAGPLELNRLTEGLNFGWPTMAGNACNPVGTSCSSAGRTRPVYTVSTGGGGFVGGAVSLDTAAPDLHARVLLVSAGDRSVRLVHDTGGTALTGQSLHVFQQGTVTGIGADHHGVVYVAIDGGLVAMRPIDGTKNSFPTRLSDIPALLRAGRGEDQTAAGVIPYRPSATLWSDGARKERFFALPGLAQLGFQPQDGWDFPTGGTIIKNFVMPLDERPGATAEQRIETRLLVKHSGGWAGYSYVWDEAESDAILLPRGLQRSLPIIEADGTPLDYSWAYPSRTDCFRCHTDAANVVLGLNTGQMNHSIEFPASGVIDNQLRAYEHVGLFTAPLPAPPDELERIPAQNDLTASLNDRARAFLHANCSYCHRPEGGGQIGTDFRWSVPLEEMGILNDRPSGFDLDIIDAWLLLPGHPEQSVLAARMESLDPAYRMPPIARSRVAREDLDMINAWITSLQVGNFWVLE